MRCLRAPGWPSVASARAESDLRSVERQCFRESCVPFGLLPSPRSQSRRGRKREFRGPAGLSIPLLGIQLRRLGARYTVSKRATQGISVCCSSSLPSLLCRQASTSCKSRRLVLLPCRVFCGLVMVSYICYICPVYALAHCLCHDQVYFHSDTDLSPMSQAEPATPGRSCPCPATDSLVQYSVQSLTFHGLSKLS